MWYRWVQDLIEDALEKFPRSSKLHLLSCFVQHVKLKNTFKALYEIEITEGLTNKIAEEDVTCFCYKTLIEQEIVEYDENDKESQGNEFSKIMAFHEGFMELEGIFAEAIASFIDFWSELLEASPYITRLYHSGSQVVDYTDVIMEKYVYLNSINPNHIRLHQAYGDFTRIVLPESNESSKAFEKLENETAVLITRQQLDTCDMRHLEEDQGRFIIINGNYKNMGIITDLGPSIPEMFGYSKAELINRNVNVLMPKIFAEVHDRLLSGYLMNTSEKAHNPHKNKIVFALNKEGYLVPCDIVIYILPTLREGVRLAGFLREVDLQKEDFDHEDVNKKTPYYIVYDADTHSIQGISQNCWASFGISSRLVEGNEGIGDVGVEDLFMDFGRLDLEKLKSEEGVEVVLDTSKLEQYHLISDQVLKEIECSGDNEGSDGMEQGTRFRQARVQLKMIAEADYFGNRVQILRFTELNQEGETQKIKSPKIIKRKEVNTATANQDQEVDDVEKSDVDSADDEIGDGSSKI